MADSNVGEGWSTSYNLLRLNTELADTFIPGMEASVIKELKVCREEKDILKQKLHIQVDRWTLDNIMFKEMTAKAVRELRLKEAEQRYEIFQKDMFLGSQQQELLLQKLKLDSALEDLESKEIQLSTLKSQLQEQRKWQDSVTGTVQEMKGKFRKENSNKSKLIIENDRKVYHLQKVLDDLDQSHKAKVEKIEVKHALAVTQLNEEIKQLVSRVDDTNAQQIRLSKERKLLQVLAQERDNLIAEQEQWHKEKQELSSVLQERETLQGELERWNSKQKEVQTVIRERDSLVAEKDRFKSREEEVLKERDRLNAQLEHLISKGEECQALEKEKDMLKYQLDLSNDHRQEEVKALIRERDFVWSQMKNLDQDYGKRFKKISEQNLQDRQEIERLGTELKGAQVGKNEIMVEMTILKLEVKRVEDLAVEKQRALEAELKELQSRLEIVEEEKELLMADAEKRESRILDLTSRKETLERQLDGAYQDQGAGEVADVVKELPEDQEILESQIEQTTQVHTHDEKKLAKSLEDLTRENGNLRRDFENLKTLYAELEEALRQQNQKPAKGVKKANNRDPTSRNLKLELEAAAICSPSDESPITVGNVRKEGQNVQTGKEKLDTGIISTQKKVKAFDKSGRENVEASKGPTSSSKTAFVPSPKVLRRRTPVDYSDSISAALGMEADENDKKPVKKRRKGVNDTGSESTQNPRPPLHTLPRNQRSSTKAAVRTLSSSKAPLSESEKNASIGSPNKTSKMMANLFSSAFSVPRLKTPSHLGT